MQKSDIERYRHISCYVRETPHQQVGVRARDTTWHKMSEVFHIKLRGDVWRILRVATDTELALSAIALSAKLQEDND